MRRVSPPPGSTIQAILGALSAALAVLAALRPEWLESLGFDPDHGSGFVEWSIPVALLLSSAVLLLSARRRRATRRLLGQTR